MIILPKIFTREFPLILCEIWGKSYSIFLGKKIKTFPRYIFIIKDGLIDTYRNSQPLVKEINKLFFQEAKRDNKFFEKFYIKYLNEFKILQKIWNKKFLTKKDLCQFAKKLTDFWQAIYAATYIPLENGVFCKNDIELMFKLYNVPIP